VNNGGSIEADRLNSSERRGHVALSAVNNGGSIEAVHAQHLKQTLEGHIIRRE